MSQRVILVVSLVFISLFGVLTLYALFRYGPRLLELISLLVLAMFAYGVVGALRHPPE